MFETQKKSYSGSTEQAESQIGGAGFHTVLTFLSEGFPYNPASQRYFEIRRNVAQSNVQLACMVYNKCCLLLCVFHLKFLDNPRYLCEFDPWHRIWEV